MSLIYVSFLDEEYFLNLLLLLAYCNKLFSVCFFIASLFAFKCTLLFYCDLRAWDIYLCSHLFENVNGGEVYFKGSKVCSLYLWGGVWSLQIFIHHFVCLPPPWEMSCYHKQGGEFVSMCLHVYSSIGFDDDN